MTPGDKAWVGLAVYVLAYDASTTKTGADTMSASFLRALDDPKRKHLTTLFWAYLVAHLFGFVPRHLDPLRRWFG